MSRVYVIAFSRPIHLPARQQYPLRVTRGRGTRVLPSPLGSGPGPYRTNISPQSSVIAIPFPGSLPVPSSDVGGSFSNCCLTSIGLGCWLGSDKRYQPVWWLSQSHSRTLQRTSALISSQPRPELSCSLLYYRSSWSIPSRDEVARLPQPIAWC